MARQQRQPSLPMLLLAFELFGIGLDRIPPVTLGTIILQVVVFQRLLKLPWESAWDVCIGARTTLTDRKGILNIFYSAFEHGDDWHLYYNMASFLIKGLDLEKRLGTKRFLYVLTVFTALTGLTSVWLSRIAEEYVDVNFGYKCSVGFSGVIFALKVLTTHYWPRQVYVVGNFLTVPASWVVWVELVLIQVMVPNVSFLGHLAGILVGVAYVNGPLKWIMDLVWTVASGDFSVFNTSTNYQTWHGSPQSHDSAPRQQERMSDSGLGGYHHTPTSAYVPPGMSEEDQLHAAINASLTENYSPFQGDGFNSQRPPYPTTEDMRSHSSNVPPPPGFRVYPNLEELRSRRMDHFL